MISLLCEWANHLTPPPVECGTPSDVIVISGAGNAGANGTYIHNPTSTNIWNSVNDTNARIRVFGGTAFLEYGLAALELYITPIADFPCIWTTGLDGTDPAPTGVYSAAPPFAWLPATEIATWTDGGGVHVGDLPNFQANADTATVSDITFGATSFLTAVVGIGNLPSLSSLDVHGNSLVSLDCSGSTSLTTLNCSSNASLTTLTLTGCTGLVTLDCNNCGLTSLNCSNLTALVTLDCHTCGALASINLTGLSSLTHLYASQCLLATLDFTDCTSIYRIDADIQDLASLVSLSGVAGKLALFFLDCSNNSVTSLDVSGCTSLDELDCYDNQLTSLNITGCTQLEYLNCYDNPALTSLDASTCSIVNGMDAHGCSLSSVNIGNSTLYGFVDLHNNSLPTGPNGVDSVLSKLASNCLANAGDCNINTAATNASPTGGVLNADYVALTGAGWTVSIN